MKKVNRQPLVSVIMPVYNAGQFLEEAIQSIIDQTYENWELLVIDDASTDNSLEIIKRFKRGNRKIKVISLKKNMNRGGDPVANIGFQKAKGKYIARMDADDVAVKSRLKKQVKFLEENIDVFMVGSQAWVIDKKGKKIGVKKVPCQSQEIYNRFFEFHPMIHPSVMIRKSEVKTKNLYQIKYSANNDLYTFFKLLRYKKFRNLSQKLVYYRVHGKNDSLTGIREKYMNTLKIRLKAVKEFGYQPTVKGVVVNIIQLVTVMMLPEKWLQKVYLMAKGILTPKDMLTDWLKKRDKAVLPSMVGYETVK